jgi:multicomponent Na+:H+ antiporter subunit D
VVVNLIFHRPRSIQPVVNLIALTLSLGASIWMLLSVYNGAGERPDVLASQIGNWPAPFGITVVGDVLAASLLSMSAAVGLVVYAYVLSQTPARFTGGYFHALFPALICGVNWSFLAADLFNLFVAFEVMLLASYSLLVAGTTPRQMRQAYKYVLLNLVVSAVFVAACGWTYGTLGTLNFAELAHLARTGAVDTRAAIAVAALAFVFGTKAAIFPLWFWLPDTYPTLPPALGGLYAGLLTKVGVYALVRLLVMVFGPAAEVAVPLTPLLLVAAGATMFLGVLGAVSSRTVRRILSVHVISQIGYMILGVALALSPMVSTEAATVAVAATLLYILHNMAAKCSLFLCCGIMEKYGGTDDLDGFGALLKRDGWLAVLFLIAALSLVGLPPLSGFFGKFLLIRESLLRGDGWGITLGALAALTGSLTLLSMVKIWSYGFWSAAPEGSPSAIRPPDYRPPRRTAGLLAVTALVGVALSLGLGAQIYYDIARAAADTVLFPDRYIDAVLGGSVLTPDAAPPVAGIRPTGEPIGGMP